MSSIADFLNVKLKMKFGAIIAQCLFDSFWLENSLMEIQIAYKVAFSLQYYWVHLATSFFVEQAVRRYILGQSVGQIDHWSLS